MNTAMPMTAADLQTLLRKARDKARTEGNAVLDALLALGTEPRLLTPALQAHAGVAVHETSAATPDFSRWDLASAKRHRCLALRDASGVLSAAAEDPWNEVALQAQARALGLQVPVVAIRREDFEKLLGTAAAPAAERAVAAEDASQVVRFVDDALATAAKAGASDVHFECDRAGVAVKHRLDGVLVKHAQLEGCNTASAGWAYAGISAPLAERICA